MTGGRWLRARWKRIFGQFRKFRTCLINTLPTIAQTPSNRQLNPNYYSLQTIDRTNDNSLFYLIQHMLLNYVSCDMIVTYVITLPIVSQFLYQSYIAFYTRLLNVTRFYHMLLIRIVYLHDLLTQPKSGFYLIEAYLNDTGFK